MSEIEFDKALSDFLDDDECEAVSEAIYQLIRGAFAAGWNAAAGAGDGGASMARGRIRGEAEALEGERPAGRFRGAQAPAGRQMK